MTVVQRYTQSLLVPQLRSLGLSKRQWEIVVEDVTQRLESLLCHWSDVHFRRTVLVLGTEEASFWRPHSANMEVRSLVVVAVRNSLIEDLGASHPYTKALRSRKTLLPDALMPWITSEAINAFQEVDLEMRRLSQDGMFLVICPVDFRTHGTSCPCLATRRTVRLSAIYRWRNLS